MQKIGVIGAGIMGHGIAQVAAQSDYQVLLRDISDELVERGMQRIEASLAKGVKKGKVTNKNKKKVLGRIKGTTELKDAKDCHLIIEAIPEEVELKKKLFADIDKLSPKETIFATNTSTISITELASATKRPDKFIGMHFFNPVQLMRLVEVIRGMHTSEETAKTVVKITKKMGKTPIEVNDYPGFVSNRILMPMINEAAYCVIEGVATKEAIDNVMRLGMAHPMGPLELADLIGLDTCVHIMETLYKGFSDSKYRPCPLLKKMVAAGLLGRKSGEGFYRYKK